MQFHVRISFMEIIILEMNLCHNFVPADTVYKAGRRTYDKALIYNIPVHLMEK